MPNPFAILGPAVLAAFGAPTAISVLRRAAGAYDGDTGKWAPADETTTTEVEAAVQPATPKEIAQLPENERTSKAIRIYTSLRLLTSDSAGAIEADRVTWQGETYRVLKVNDWAVQAGYYESIATRVGS